MTKRSFDLVLSNSSTNSDNDASEQAKDASAQVLRTYVEAYAQAETEEDRADVKQRAVEAAYLNAVVIDARITRAVISQQWGGVYSSSTRSVNRANSTPEQPLVEPVADTSTRATIACHGRATHSR